MRLYIIRHADPDYPNNTITEYGHKEAEALAPRLVREGITQIFASPLGRAIDTARYTADVLNLEIKIEPWTEEWSGMVVDLEAEYGRFSVWDMPGEIIRAHPECLRDSPGAARIPHATKAPVLERWQAVETGADDFLLRQGYAREGDRYRCVAPTRERVALFCHDGFGRALIAHLLGLPLGLVWAGFWLPPSSVTTIFFEQRSETWAVPRCIGLGDVSHLYAANLPVRPRGMFALDLAWEPGKQIV